MCKLMQIAHADRALAIARRAGRTCDPNGFSAVAMTKDGECEPVELLDHIALKDAPAIICHAKAVNAEERLHEVTVLEGLAAGDVKFAGIEQASSNTGERARGQTQRIRDER